MEKSINFGIGIQQLLLLLLLLIYLFIQEVWFSPGFEVLTCTLNSVQPMCIKQSLSNSLRMTTFKSLSVFIRKI